MSNRHASDNNTENGYDSFANVVAAVFADALAALSISPAIAVEGESTGGSVLFHTDFNTSSVVWFSARSVTLNERERERAQAEYRPNQGRPPFEKEGRVIHTIS